MIKFWISNFFKGSFTPFFLLLLAIVILFYPVLFENKIPLSVNLLVSAYNPWREEKFPGWNVGIPNKPTGVDDIKIFYPQETFTHASLLSGILPVWNPYIFSGNYQIGQSETAVFYPPFFLLFFLLPQSLAWVVLIMLEPFIVGLGMYLFLTKLHMKKSAALFGSFAFTFCSVMLIRMVEGISTEHSIIWLPLSLFAIESFFQEKRIRYIILLLICLVFSFLAGWFQFAFYSILFSFLYTCFKFLQEKKKDNLLIFIAFISLPFLTLFQNIQDIQAFLDSPRGLQAESTLINNLMPLQHVITFLFPDFWGNLGSYNFFGPSVQKESAVFTGIVPFFFGLLSISLWRKNKTVLFFTVTFFVSLLLGFDNPFSRFFVHLPIPIVSSFLPNRIFILSALSLSVLSAYGIELFMQNDTNISLRLPLWTISILTGVTVVYVGITEFLQKLTIIHKSFLPIYEKLMQLSFITKPMQISIEARNTIIPLFSILLLFTFIFFRKRLNGKIFLLFFILLFSMQFYEAEKYFPFSEKQFIFPKTTLFTYLETNAGYNRFISLGEKGSILPNFTLPFKLFTPDGVGAMYPERYGELVAFVQSHGLEVSPNRIEVRINPTSKSLFDENDFYMNRFLQIDGVKYLVSLTNAQKATENGSKRNTTLFPLVKKYNNWEIIENSDALPRAYWTDTFIVTNNKTNVLKHLFSSKFNPKTLVLETFPSFIKTPHATGTVRITGYSPQSVTLESTATGAGLVYLSDNYSNAFAARIDNKPASILRADYSFRAIVVPAGHHKIVEYYDNRPILIGFIVAFTTVIVLAIGSFLLIWKKFFVW